MPASISRREFIQSHGATCKNWNWSWSFVNHNEKIVIFGAWDTNTEGSKALILDPAWERNDEGRKNAGFPQSLEHVGLIEDQGYALMTFPIIYSGERKDDHGAGPAKIEGFIPELSPMTLLKDGGCWYAVAGKRSPRAWLFQGNPKRFDIDDYLARYPELIYWNAPRYQSAIAVGDRAFIWRAGATAGVVAHGIIAERPTPASEVLHPEALDDDLWFAEKPNPDAPSVGIALKAVRLSAAEGMVPRDAFRDDPLLQQSTIIRMANGTVYSLKPEESARIQTLWAAAIDDAGTANGSGASAIEGDIKLHAHRRRERSQYLRGRKLEEFRRLHGSLHCEVCRISENGRYPSDLASGIFEVHHVRPLAEAASPRRTTLTDLAVLCANCHRAVHTTRDAETNLATLAQLLRTESPVDPL